MNTQLLLQDAVVAVALAAGIWLYRISLVRKLSEKMDTMRVRKISRRFLAMSLALMGSLMVCGVLYQSGDLQGILAYIVIGGIGCISVVCLQVFNRFIR